MRRAVIGASLAVLVGVGCAGPPGGWLVGAPSPEPVPASPLPPFEPGEDRIVQVVRRIGPAVVSVTSNLSTEAGLEGAGRNQGEGTGFIVQADGIIVTNFHVVERGLNIRVVTAEGDNLNARVIGGDPDADLAVLEVQPEEPLPVVPLGRSGALELGEPVVALGFALGLEGGPSVTSGIVSATGRSIRAGGVGSPTRLYEDLIQTDAAINPGNSGGPLVDLDGRVVGINTAGVQAAAVENIGFAIAIDRARPIIEEAIADPAAPQPYMGVATETVTALEVAQFGLPVGQGALVIDVAPGGPADRAGISPGDVIVTTAGQPIVSRDALGEAIREHQPREEIEVTVVHPDGREESIDVTLGIRPLPVGQG